MSQYDTLFQLPRTQPNFNIKEEYLFFLISGQKVKILHTFINHVLKKAVCEHGTFHSNAPDLCQQILTLIQERH